MKNQDPDFCPIPLSKRVLSYFLKVVFFILTPLKWMFSGLFFAYGSLEFKFFRLTFPVRKSDVFIVTYPRSGTTWMQMILYQLLTDGNMNFRHISERIPWYDKLQGGIRPYILFTTPRVFKTHLPYKKIPKYPCKYIYVVRDGRDVAVSYYYNYRHLLSYGGTFEDFFSMYMRGKVEYGSWFGHVKEWYGNPSRLEVLYLTYEDMKKDLEGTIRKVAGFCGIAIDENNFNSILQRCSLSFMKEHEKKFERLTELMIERNHTFGHFIRKGKVGDWTSHFTPGQEKIFTAEYQRTLAGIGDITLENEPGK